MKRWQQSILLGYAGFFALVLPFLCWGSAGNPGHAHAHAHWIFADPHEDHPVTAAQYLRALQLARRHLHTVEKVTAGHTHAHAHVAPHPILIQGEAQGDRLQHDQPLATDSRFDLRSTPELSALSLLLMLLSRLGALCRRLLRLFPILVLCPFPELPTPLVPVPPPRLASLQCV